MKCTLMFLVFSFGFAPLIQAQSPPVHTTRESILALRSVSPDSANSADFVTDWLFRRYVMVNGKISTRTVNAAIELVASQGGCSPKFMETLQEEFEKSCESKNAQTVRNNLLKVIRKILATEGGWRWNYEYRQRTPNAPPQAAVMPSDPKTLYAESKLLARLIDRGRNSGSGDIDTFVLAVRAAHHPQGKSFLLDVLRNPESTADPFAIVPQQAPRAKPQLEKGKWPDNQGGSWRDAKYHAAVALAELGEAEGVEWLMEKATPNDFGNGGSVSRGQHVHCLRGSLQENCRYALADLSGLQLTDGVNWWVGWWTENKDDFSPKPVALRLD